MQDTKYIFLVLLPSLLMILTGCSRRDVLDDYPVSGVNIMLDWEGVTDELPEGVRVIFYPKNAGGKKVDTYLPVKGGGVKVPPGRYSVVLYNYNTEMVQIEGEGAYETIEAFTGSCTGLCIVGMENIVWGPDPLYTVHLDDLYIENSEEELLLHWKPKLVVKTYSFKIKVEGLEYVSSVVGSVDGMAGRYYLGLHYGREGDGPIFFEASKHSGEIVGSFTAFGTSASAITRAGNTIKMTLSFTKTDNTIQKIELDITDVVANSEKEEGGGEGESSNEAELEFDDDNGIEVEKPSNPPPGSGGGIGGDVGEWGDEDEVELPVI